MAFGEIVEPSTRALIDDEFEEYPPYTKSALLWQSDVNVPAELNTLIFVEGPKITKLCDAFILNTEMLHCSLKSGTLKIYKITPEIYLVIYVKKDLPTGEIVEELQEWLKKATNLYSVVSQPISAYQNLNLEKPETLIRSLSTEKDGTGFKYKKLESPNLVSGLGADILSFSIHTGLNSTLFVVYMDNSPLDSVNTSPVTELMKTLNLPVKVTRSNLNPTASNLYL